MPRVKIDYVVSVSSEDPNHPASNLLASEVGKQRWVCGAGEREAAVLLQLRRAVTICGVHIGAYQAAFVEVLVGTADRPDDQYEVLVPRCVFAEAAQSRRAGTAGAAASRVRSFDAAQLAEGARQRRWDRVRLLCSQPYNKHCQSSSAPAPGDKLLSLGSYSSDEDEFQPGALFAQHQQRLKQPDDSALSCTANTDAQIRKASVQALKNIAEADTRLKKTVIEKCSDKSEMGCAPAGARASRRDSAGSRRSVGESSTRTASGSQGKPYGSGTQRDGDKSKTGGWQRRAAAAPSRPELEAAGASAGGRAVLRGVVFAMSGFVNPERAELRAAGTALGARYRPDWSADCTHLVCAFPNTPKLRKVVASAPHAYVVSGEWLRACRRRQRREPEAAHALGPPRTPRPAPHLPQSTSTDDTDDTDDEIEEVRARSKRPRHSAAAAPPASPSDNDVSFVCDERFKGSVTLSDDSDATTEEEAASDTAAAGGALPDFLQGLSFVVATGAGYDERLLARYVRAYGGLLLQDSGLEGATVDYVLCTSDSGGAEGVRGLRVRADWLWRCHRLRALAPTRPYELPS